MFTRRSTVLWLLLGWLGGGWMNGRAEDAPAQEVSAADMAARLSAVRQDGFSFVRLRMEVRQAGGGKSVFQLQVKARRAAKGSDLLYQLLWPRERKGEAVLLHKSAGRAPTGQMLVPPGEPRALTAAELRQGLFGSDLAIDELIENFYAWDHQSYVGTEVVDGVNCRILESKPGKGEWASCARVRSWVDMRRAVPLRIEKYASSGELVRRIDTRRVVKDEEGRHVPATVVVQRPGQAGSTEIEGTRNVRGVTFTDADFTPEGMKELAAPRAAE